MTKTPHYLPGALRYILRRHQDQISLDLTYALENAIDIAEDDLEKEEQ
ncbi:hypothetical protein MHT86_08200 [Corynebacterium mastitidis]|nr:hypothetical protein [Corynebacterium mastitidis]MCH6197475.1 hypothetical protein [Corynebacterium mastitidis]